ncbi:MAG: hypothetical protein JW716_05175 [Candidatus Aenigmarchaeota archaeon]|nr:hypothetical protein [Candidatus Aenigmarchaeota archaeon]
MGIWNERFRAILVFTLLIVIGIGVGRFLGPVPLTGAAVSDGCELVEVPREVCRDVVVPYEYMANKEEQVPYSEEACEGREYDSGAYYLFGDSMGDEWSNGGTGYHMTALSKGRIIESRIYNNEDKEGVFSVELRVWSDKGYNKIYETRRDFVVDADSFFDFKIRTDEMISEMGDKFREGLSFSAILIKPELEECENVVKYYSVNKPKPEVGYRIEEVCETEYKTEKVCDNSYDVWYGAGKTFDNS